MLDMAKTQTWAERLRVQRDDRKLSNDDLAALLGVSIRTIHSWLYGERTPSPSGQKLIQLLEENKI